MKTIYAFCEFCKTHFILEDHEHELGEYPCDPCPECSYSPVHVELNPNMVIGVHSPLQYFWDGKRVSPQESFKQREKVVEKKLSGEKPEQSK